MIEKCNYCGNTHDVGDGDTFNGMVLKTCPEVHPLQPIMWNPKEWQRIYDGTRLNLTNSQNLSTSNQDNS